MINVKKVLAALSLTLLLTSSSLYAAQEMQKSASKLLKESYNYLGSMQKYAFKATVNNDIHEDGTVISEKRTSDVKVQRPDKFRVDTKSDHINRTVYLSNGQFTMIDNDENYYASVHKTGASIDTALQYISKKLGVVLPLSTLIHSDMNKFIHPSRVQYFGTEVLSGVECNYIAFRQGTTTVHLWVENSDRPLIHAAKIITDAKNYKGTTDMIIKWNTNPDFSDSSFVFKAPKGASNVSIKPVK